MAKFGVGGGVFTCSFCRLAVAVLGCHANCRDGSSLTTTSGGMTTSRASTTTC